MMSDLESVFICAVICVVPIIIYGAGLMIVFRASNDSLLLRIKVIQTSLELIERAQREQK